MTANHDLERRIADFYANEAPGRAPDWVLEQALTTIESTPQRRVLARAPWRIPTMNSYARVAIAAVAVIAVGAVGLAVLRPGQTPGVGGGPSPSPSSVPTPSLSPSPSNRPLTQSFTSTRYGFSISFPAGWVARPATEPWTFGLPGGDSLEWDYVYDGSTGDTAFLGLASQALEGKSGDEWAAELSTHADWRDSCAVSTEPVTIGGASGLLVVHCPDDVPSAFVAVEDRGYLIVGYRLPSLEYFKEILATVQLLPGDAVDVAPSVTP